MTASFSTNPAPQTRQTIYLDIHPQNDQCAEHYVNMIVNNANPKSISLEQIEKETFKDIILQQVITAIKKNKWSNIYNHILPYAINLVFTTIFH